jgi:heat shock protein HslJ
MQPARTSVVVRTSLIGLVVASMLGNGCRATAETVPSEAESARLSSADASPSVPADSTDASSPTTARFQCPAGLGLLATFTSGDTPSVRIEVGTNVWILRRVPSASGAKYSDGTASFWTKGDSARFESPDLSMTCTAVGPTADGLKALTGTAWKLVSVTQNGVTTGVPEGVKVDAFFEDGRVAGSGVCNRYFASYKASNDETLSIGDIGATMMMCPNHHDFERLYFRVLKDSTRFEARGGALVLSTPSGSLRFVEDK